MSKSKYSKEYKQKKRSRMAMKLLIFFGIVVLIFGGIFYSLFFAKAFDVREIEIQGNKSVDTMEISTMVTKWLDDSALGIKHRQNSFFFSKNDLENLIENTFSKIENASVNKKDRHTIQVDIKEREAIGIWCIVKNDTCYFFDINAIAYTEVAKSAGFIYSNISDYRDRTIKIGNKVEDKVWIDNILQTQRTLLFGKISVEGFHIASDSVDIFAVDTAEGWEIRLSNKTNIARQLESLFNFLKNKITPEELEVLQYIDLTVQDRIYYK